LIAQLADIVRQRDQVPQLTIVTPDIIVRPGQKHQRGNLINCPMDVLLVLAVTVRLDIIAHRDQQLRMENHILWQLANAHLPTIVTASQEHIEALQMEKVLLIAQPVLLDIIAQARQ
jgi:hypothetical protein